jgi:superfamily I DNA/RNA helicase
MRISGKLPENIDFRTFQGWCYQHWPQDLSWIDPLSEQQRKQFARQAWQKHLAGTNVTEGMLLSEINWMQDQPSLTKEAYLRADRRGRGFALNAAQRELLFAASEAYQEFLRVNAARDWNEVPGCIWHALQEKQEDFPQYDVILIDETQFFAPLWIQIIQRLLRDQNAHLFMVADPPQGFLGRGSSWKSLGLEARDRTHRLQRSYRTTRQIMELATQFYRLRVEAEPDDDILAPDLLNMPDGATPQLVCLQSTQDEIARVSNEVAELVEKGLPRRHLLLLHANGQGVNALIQSLNRRLGKDAAMNPKDTCPGNYIRVTTLNAGGRLSLWFFRQC